ncbi:hypothetical protein A3K86_20150 [Photobacterium jeanii]|uniref:Nudix hydrolase domain-containing protein n=1 Tax=Photobacterium jeanii TaxID=858640 RepID=A0A178K1T7_9GAMM|nr:NUDIX domain-containing protein [Photobacterium jeanii]OAN11270.1 hypothetical protein A3K86_20150 [Photobacterium jeanii]PST90790.1 NUDIX domain-containing protein [Photobacterium jeanii]
MSFHYVVRSVVLSENQLLAVRVVGDDKFFLPGGHIEFGEPAKHALRREFQEELGITADVGAFLGAVENEWMEKSERQCEVNLLFTASSPNLVASELVISKEPHLEFLWLPLTEQGLASLYPPSLRTWLVSLAGQKINLENTELVAFWGSDLVKGN